VNDVDNQYTGKQSVEMGFM